MFDQNIAEFTKSNILTYHQNGKLGQGKVFAILDDWSQPADWQDYIETPLGWTTEDTHGHSCSVAKVVHEGSPLSRKVSLPFTYANDENKMKTVEWVEKNRPDFMICSFHTAPSPILERLLATNIPMICAAGNQSNKENVAYPARYAKSIAVGALEEYRDMLASYSNWGNDLDGICFTNIEVPTTNGTMSFNGTSCAAPLCGAMLSLLDISFTADEAQQYLWGHCKDYYDPGFDIKSGWGLFVLPELVVKEEPEMEIKLTIGSNRMLVDGTVVMLDAPPVLNNGRVMIPLRAPLEAAGLLVKWDQLTKTATISDK